ncbi:unnamed protein product [Protopolystoma xenopodis]|uniref:Uncharacterized protein n=1 Tax=Protopolystoma xenopodis TaxID=117903 RepID=A0A3S5C659_9PLAT|nr:unnamed protein product [Protopolystoma xenopodis]
MHIWAEDVSLKKICTEARPVMPPCRAGGYNLDEGCFSLSWPVPTSPVTHSPWQPCAAALQPIRDKSETVVCVKN